ncbi:MAG: Omp28-related outer membrane protein [Saprospiraceae bacterium]
MKQILLFTFFVSFLCLFSGCKKDPEYNNEGSYQKKVLVEEFTGEWCGFCPAGAKKLREIMSSYPEEATCVGMHIDDKLEVEFPTTSRLLSESIGPGYFPSAIINRKYDSGSEWIVQVRNQINKTSDIGIKIESNIVDNYLDITVNCISENSYGNVFLTVYLTEDNVDETSPGAQSNGGGDYVHPNVLREVLTSSYGNPISLEAGQVISVEFKDISVSKYKIDDLNVVALINYGADNDFAVLNTNFIKAGNDVDW